MIEHLKEVLSTANNIALAGVQAGQEIGAREAALKARRLIEALQWCVDHDGECLGDHPAQLAHAREAIAAYRATA